MSKTKKILIYLLIIGLIIAGLIIFSKRSNVNTTGVSLKTISDHNAVKPVVHDNKIFYIKDSKTLALIDIPTNETKDIYRANGKIVDFYLSPEADKAIVAVDSSDEVKNNLVNVGSGQAREIEQCLAEAIAWIDNENILANCYIEPELYSANITNNIITSKEDGSSQAKIVDLQFDPPKKLFKSSDQKYFMLTANAGYKTNDLYSLNKNDKKLTKATDNGLINDAVQVSDSLFLITSGADQAETRVELFDANKSSTTKIDGVETLDLVTSNGSEIVTYQITEDRKSLVFADVASPNKAKRNININYDKEIAKILYAGDRILLFGPDGIGEISNI